MSCSFLTDKPVLYVANMSEQQLTELNNIENFQSLKNKAENEEAELIELSAVFELELIDLETDEKEIFLNELGLEEPGLKKVDSGWI